VDDALSSTLLFNKDEVRPTEGLRTPEPSLVGAAELAAAKEYIEALSTDFRHDKYSDPYRAALLAVIEPKAELQEQEPLAPFRSPSTLPDLIAALNSAVDETRAKNERPTRKRKSLAASQA
jgi:DNA end-binding protein Ku